MAFGGYDVLHGHCSVTQPQLPFPKQTYERTFQPPQ